LSAMGGFWECTAGIFGRSGGAVGNDLGAPGGRKVAFRQAYREVTFAVDGR